MSDPLKENKDKTILTEGHQPLQKGHTVVNISSIGENPPTGGSGVATTSDTADSSNSSQTNNSSTDSQTNTTDKSDS